MASSPLVVATVVSDRTPHGTFRTPTADGATGVALGDGVGRAAGAPAVGLGDGGATGTGREGEGVAVGVTVAGGADAGGVGTGVAEGGAVLAADAPLGTGAAVAATELVGVGESDGSVETPPPAPAQAAKRSPSNPAQAALPRSRSPMK